MTGSGQKTAPELFELNRADAQVALGDEKMPNTQFQGALAELFVTHYMDWDCVSGPEIDAYDALRGTIKIEIKSSANGRKPSAKGKDYDEFCWLKLELSGTEIWATEITVGREGEPHTVNLLDEKVCIFDASPKCRSAGWPKKSTSR